MEINELINKKISFDDLREDVCADSDMQREHLFENKELTPDGKLIVPVAFENK